MPLTLPPTEYVDAIHGSVSRVTRRVAFFESDGATPWEPEGVGINPPLVGGSVSLDHGRDERRTLDLTIYNEGGLYTPGDGSLWYDKIVRVYRGVQTDAGSWEATLGTFLIDNLDSPHFPRTIKIVGRDKSKLLRSSLFPTATLFPLNHPIEDVVKDIAVNGGIDIADIDVPITGESLDYDYVLEAGSDRWSAIKEVCTSYGYEVFFDPEGVLTMRAFQDPYTLPAEYTFQTGASGNIATYSKKLSDAFLKNHVVVAGENASQVPVFAEASNTDPTSPTRIAKIGQRTHMYNSSFITTQVQAQEVADNFLKVMALEQYELNLSTIVVPYIDVGIVVGFTDPNPMVGDPVEYLMQTVTIPLDLTPMSATAGRVTQIIATP